MKISRIFLLLGAAVLLAACSSEPPRSAEEIVSERAKARWDAMVEQDFEAAWQYYTPGFREQLPARDFALEMARRPVEWTSAEILEVTCEAAEPRCQVRSRVDYQAPAGLPGVGTLKSKSAVDEIWLQIDGEWWYSSNA